MTPSTAAPTFVLIPGMGRDLVHVDPAGPRACHARHRALPVELPCHGFDAVFPAGYQCPQEDHTIATAPSPLAELSLEDYVAHTLQVVRRAADHGPVVLVGHSMGGSTVTGVANSAPELLARIVYLCAYCCVELPNLPAYAPKAGDADGLLTRARELVWVGDPVRTGTSRTNPRTRDPQVLATQHALMMADLDPAMTPAVLNYALQPDESLQVILADARVNPATWVHVPRTYIRATNDRVIRPSVQDRMIAEADALDPTNPFDVHTLTTSHFAPITQPAEIADILAGCTATTPARTA